MTQRISTFILIVLVGITIYRPAGAQGDFEDLTRKINNNTYQKVTSVLVQHDGQILYERYFNGGSVEHLNNIRSASKSITAILFGQAIDQGLFASANDRVAEYFPNLSLTDVADTFKQKITFTDLMTMSSALECDDWNQFSAGNEERMYLHKDWIKFAFSLPERGTPPWEKTAQNRKYGRRFTYCTAGAFLTGAAIEQQAKNGLDAFAQEHLFTPLGIRQVAWPKSPMGVTQGGGGLEIRSRDLLKIGQLMVNNGVYENKALIKRSWIQDMFQPRAVAIEDRMIDYGYLWWVVPFEHKNATVHAYAANGNGGNYLFLMPEERLVVVITATAFNTDYMHKQAHEIFAQYALPLLGQQPQ